MSGISAALHRVLNEYGTARSEPFEDHPLANFIRNDLADIVSSTFPSSVDRYKVVGSPGKGQWTKGPWVAILDTTVTDSAQRGFYVVLLFKEDLTGVYLSLNQGVTDVVKQYAAGAAEVLEIRARDLAARVDKYPVEFKPGRIDLASSGPLTRNYEIGSALAQFFAKDKIPTDEIVQAKVRTMLELYRRIIASGGMTPISRTDDDSDLPPELVEEDLTAFREHKRVERDPRIAAVVKKLKGYICEVCGLNFEQMYGEIGRQYIEAHHLQPVSQLKGQKLMKDPKGDFAVLCANCHRMIHRTGAPHDVENLRRLVSGRNSSSKPE